MIPKYFKLGGMEYQVLLEEVPGYRWKVLESVHEIHLAPKYEGVELRESMITKHFWEAISSIIIDKVMIRKKPHWENHRCAYGSLVAQLMMQLSNTWGDRWIGMNMEYTLKIGGTEVSVRFDNEECKKRKVFGTYDHNNGIILLSYEGVADEAFRIYSPNFITRVLIHECLHAVTNELALNKTKWNSEHHVNTMAFFLSEVLLTLKSRVIVAEAEEELQPTTKEIEEEVTRRWNSTIYNPKGCRTQKSIREEVMEEFKNKNNGKENNTI